MKRKKVVLGVTLFIIIMILVLLGSISGLIINIEWFSDLNYLDVYFKKLEAVLVLMVPIFAVCFFGIYLYYKSIKKSIIKWKSEYEYDIKKVKMQKRIFIICDLVVSFSIAYVFSNTYWYDILQFFNSTSFGKKDPVFNIDLSFYIFKLPLIQSLYEVLMSILVFMVIITLILYFFMNFKYTSLGNKNQNIFDSFKSNKNGLGVFAGRQLAVVSALILLLMSLGYMIKSWNLVYSTRGVVFGAGYTDVNVSKPFYIVIAAACLIASIIVFISILASKFKPIIASIFVIIFLIAAQAVVSAAVQGLVVKSNEKELERPYIQNNINSTRDAFNLSNINVQSFKIDNTLTADDISKNQDIVSNIRINSYKPSLEFYNQVQTVKYYYKFDDVDIDRYKINGKYMQVFIAPREIDSDTIQPNTWQNRHLVYTRGYGVAMSKVNSVTSEGQPDFLIKDLPITNNTDIKLDESRIYFGEKTDDYAIVNTDLDEVELNTKDKTNREKYNGKTGIKMSFLNKVIFAVNKGDLNFILSRDINSDSKILINRNIMDRVKKIAPFLEYDSDPYMVIDNGKLYWIVDAFTETDRYPYSESKGDTNYIRNSVKVVINATDGSTNFYIIDKSDPIVSTYAKIFPHLFKNSDEIPEGIREHLRYPGDLFSIQSIMLEKYHVTDPQVFYSNSDLWEMSKNQTNVTTSGGIQEPPYIIMRLPGNSTDEMTLLGYYNVRSKNNMSSIIAARMDGENYGKLVLYNLTSSEEDSPLMFNQRVNQDTTIAGDLTLWNKEGSQVMFGDTIIIPIKNSLLYVEPLYLRANGKSSVPEMKRVIVSYNEKIIEAPNIEAALKQLFNYQGENKNTPADNNPGNTSAQTDKTSLLKMKDLFNKAIEAQKAGKWSEYGEYINQLGDMLNGAAGK